MHRRGYRGYAAATTAAITLSLVFLVVEKHNSVPSARRSIRQDITDTGSATKPALPSESKASQVAQTPVPRPEEADFPSNLQLPPAPESSPKLRMAADPNDSILLSVDPAIVETVVSYPSAEETEIRREAVSEVARPADRIQQPPEPVANVVLFAPIADYQLTELPLHVSDSGIHYLMDAMDAAFDRPTRVVSAHRAPPNAPSFTLDTSLPEIPAPATTQRKLPEPTALLDGLAELQRLVDPRFGSPSSHYVTTRSLSAPQPQMAAAINQWIVEVQKLLHRVTYEYGLENTKSTADIQRLATLASQAAGTANQLTDYRVAGEMLRLAYAVQRRVDVWTAIQQSLDGTTIALNKPRSPQYAREQIIASLQEVEKRLGETGDGPTWRKFLLIEELENWAQRSEVDWSSTDALVHQVVGRLHWPNLTHAQKQFLAQPCFQDLAANLVVWGRDPVDYRQLLTDIEELEQDSISRVTTELAGGMQALALSDGPSQRLVARTLDTHYRNANMRVSVSSELLKRFLPHGQYEVRPVRQRILGADTLGSSAVQTQLDLQLIPDRDAWHVNVGVSGDMLSNTRSSKGPAVFHSTSTAQIESHRYVRVDREGYTVSSQPTNVRSSDYLKKMSTNYDGMPVIGDFVRLLVREQFDQKRSLAQKISRRIIAREADAELDRRLEEAMESAEDKLSQYLVGPLEQLELNPTVSSLSTTDERLTVRYRVANESQMAAFTPRPRAPSDSLLSVQLHQSSINNAIAQLGLGERSWNIKDLYQHLGRTFQQTDWTLPEDVPEDITIRFARSRPATVEMLDGKLRLTLRIAELSQPSRDFKVERFLVQLNYVPVASGLNAELLRDGTIEIVSQRSRLALRVIFAKVFVSQPQIPLTSREWAHDERAQGLAVSQLDIRDGWLAVAISESDSQLASEVAARAEYEKARR